MLFRSGKKYDASHGTQSRNIWNMIRDNPKLRDEYLLQMFGRKDRDLARILDKIPVNEDSNLPVAVDSISPIHGSGSGAMNEEAAGVGVVKNSKDPRYIMATMGDQNDVTAQTLPKEMRAYGLIGRKSPGVKK